MKNKLKDFVTFSLIILVFYFGLNIIGEGCPIKFFTGISCAGCGMTRAYKNILKGNINRAFYYHPLFPMPLIYFILFLFKEKVPVKIYNLLIILGLIVFSMVYIIRIFNPDDTVVNIDIKNGLIYYFINYMFRGNNND